MNCVSFVTDVLTSMVKILADLYMATCLLIMNQFNTPKDHGSCHRSKYIGIPIIIMLPYWWRFLQCLRKYKETGRRFPHVVNAVKYCFGMTVKQHF